MKLVINFTILLFILQTTFLDAQSLPLVTNDYPEIGKSLTDFTLNEIHYYKKKNTSSVDFKGRWLVLDFFSAGCTSCFASFQHVNQMAKEFDRQVQFVLIGSSDKFTPTAFEKARQRLKLNLPVSYDVDKTLFGRFGVTSVPHIIVIDESGVVRAVTSKIDSNDIREYLAGNTPFLNKKLNVLEEQERIPYNFQKPLLVDGNGGADSTFLFRSLLTAYNGVHLTNQGFISTKYFGNRVQVVGLSLIHLYNLAYGDTLFSQAEEERGSSYGKYWPTPLLEVSDSSEFQFDIGSTSNRFNYSLIVPKKRATTEYLQAVMRNDLYNYFGYDVDVEKRMMPCWKLTATEKARKSLETKGSVRKEKEYPMNGGISLVNKPINILIHELWQYHQGQPPFIDETGIRGNIDIEVNSLLTDFEDFKHALSKKGLNMVKGEKEMKVIVIRDKLDN